MVLAFLFSTICTKYIAIPQDVQNVCNFDFLQPMTICSTTPIFSCLPGSYFGVDARHCFEGVHLNTRSLSWLYACNMVVSE